MDAPRKHRSLVTRDTFAILVALSAGAQTGSEVQSRIIGESVGLYVRISSLYTILRRLEDMDLIKSHAKQYTLTQRGWHVLNIETHTLESLVKNAKSRIISSGHGKW